MARRVPGLCKGLGATAEQRRILRAGLGKRSPRTGGRVTRSEWLAKAEAVERKLAELLEGEDASSSYVDYLRAKAQAARFLAANAPEEE
jgi:hypothetical protein